MHLRPRGLVLVQRRGQEAERLRRHEELVVQARYAVAPRRPSFIEVPAKVPPRVDGEGRQRPQGPDQELRVALVRALEDELPVAPAAAPFQ